jgi:hypothetical protein
MTIPKPDGKRCVYCGQSVYDWEDAVASKPKKGDWVYAHLDCAYPKKEADKGVRLK